MSKKIKIIRLSAMMFAVTLLLSVFVLWTMDVSMNSMSELQAVSDQYLQEQNAISSMREASDYLTMQAREFVVTGDLEYLENYFDEVRVAKRRDAALEALRADNSNESIPGALEKALQYSNELMQIELQAMRLAAESNEISQAEIKNYLGDVVLSNEDKALTRQEQADKALSLMFDETYLSYKTKINEEVYDGLDTLLEASREKQDAAFAYSNRLLLWKRVLILLMLAAFLAMFLTNAVTLIVPLSRSIKYIQKNEKLPLDGAAEYVYLADAYNNMLEKNLKSQDKLTYEASHDSLTGLYNRKMFEEKRKEFAGDNIAMIIFDIDHFKEFNDNYGHEMGDRVLKKVSTALVSCFRNEDYVCRIGGDEFAAIMVQMNPELKHVILDKVERLKKKLLVEDGLPEITLSIGAAFNEEAVEGKELFKIADEALYRTKERGRNGFTFYSDPPMEGESPRNSEGL
ncbi:MAG: diguanylate cyclase [Oscillospiraceae bacterium]|nr:diguanylate cyclase [Oscillospiraceae bacterium]